MRTRQATFLFLFFPFFLFIADVSGTGAIKRVEKTNTPTDAERNIAETKAKLKHQQSVLKLQQVI